MSKPFILTQKALYTRNNLSDAAPTSLSLATPMPPAQPRKYRARSPFIPQAPLSLLRCLLHLRLRRLLTMHPTPKISVPPPFGRLIHNLSASGVVSPATRLQLATQPAPAAQSGQSWSSGMEADSLIAMQGTSASSSMSLAAAKESDWGSVWDFMESTLVRFVETHTTEHVHVPTTDLDQVLYIIVSPYVPSAWQRVLDAANITHLFPNLVHDIAFGSPIGNPPPLTQTFIPPNLALADI